MTNYYFEFSDVKIPPATYPHIKYKSNLVYITIATIFISSSFSDLCTIYQSVNDSDIARH